MKSENTFKISILKKSQGRAGPAGPGAFDKCPGLAGWPR